LDLPSFWRRVLALAAGVDPEHGVGQRTLQVKCHRCETEASIPLEHVRRPRDTPI
jgi:hypothetical protein